MPNKPSAVVSAGLAPRGSQHLPVGARVAHQAGERVWEGGGYGPRRDRRPFRYGAFVPDVILLGELVERAGSPRKDSVARRIIQGLPTQPIVSGESAAKAYGVTGTAARAALNQLQSAGILQPTRAGRRRDREWTSDELFQLLDAFEYNLGEPEVGGPRRPAPPPTRPPRARSSPSE